MSFKETIKINKFVQNTHEFLEEYRREIPLFSVEMIETLVSLINIKFRRLDELKRQDILKSCLDGFMNEDTIRNTYYYLKNKGLIGDAHFTDILSYYFKKYVLKKTLLVL
jgi:hypothetical protein